MQCMCFACLRVYFAGLAGLLLGQATVGMALIKRLLYNKPAAYAQPGDKSLHSTASYCCADAQVRPGGKEPRPNQTQTYHRLREVPPVFDVLVDPARVTSDLLRCHLQRGQRRRIV